MVPRGALIIIFSVLMHAFAADAENVTDSSPGQSEHEDQLDDDQAIKEIEKNMKDAVSGVIKRILPHLISSGSGKNVSGQCISSMMKIIGGVRQLNEWAVRFIDSSGKIPPGILEGTSLSLGDYDECLDISVGKKHNPPLSADDVLFKGQYCLLQLHRSPAIARSVAAFRNGNKNAAIAKSKTFLNIFVRYKNIEAGDFKLGVCVPSKCSRADLQTMLGSGSVGFLGRIDVAYCTQSDDNERTVEQMILLAIFGFVCGCVVLGTAADVYFRCSEGDRMKPVDKPNCAVKIIRSVSVYSNALDMLDTSNNHEPLKILCGLRTITVLITIYGHTYGHIHDLHFQKFTRPANFMRFFENFAFSGISNGSVSMDTVIFISALTITYRRWRNTSEKGSVSLKIPGLLVQRYCRLTLAQLLAIGMFLLVPLIGSGPLWPAYMDPLLDNCRERWWLNVLYIGNFWSSKKTCIYHTWVLAVIMHLTLLGAFIIWILKRSPKAGILFMIILIFGGVVAVAIMTAINDLPGSMAFFMLDGRTGPMTWRNVYTLAYDHVGPFCIGLLTGYFLAKKERTLEIRRHHAAILWCIGIACNTAVIFGLYRYRNGLKMEMSLSTFYAVTHRNVWAMGIAWLVIACSTGHGGAVTKVLSAKIFVPLDRLCYMAFLLHLPIMFYHSGTIRERWYMGHLEMYVRAMAYMVFSFMLSCLTYVMFLRPYFFLESELRSIWKRRDEIRFRKRSTMTSSSASTEAQPPNDTYAHHSTSTEAQPPNDTYAHHSTSTETTPDL